MDLEQIAVHMKGVAGVLDVHDLHVWSLGEKTHALSCHVLIEDMPPSESTRILKRSTDVLCGVGIHHTTIQFEHIPCVISDQGCHMNTTTSHEGHFH